MNNQTGNLQPQTSLIDKIRLLNYRQDATSQRKLFEKYINENWWSSDKVDGSYGKPKNWFLTYDRYP